LIREGKFGFAEGFALLFISNVARVFIPFPSFVVRDGHNLGWVLVLAGTVDALLQFWVITLLMRRHRQQTIVEACEEILGPYLGTLVNLSFALYFIAVEGILLREYGEALLIAALPRTPISVVLVALLLAGLIGCFYGLEAMARVARLSLSFIALGLLLLFVTLIGFVDTTNLYPLGSNHPFKLLVTAAERYSLVSEGLLAAVIIQGLGSWRPFRRAGMAALAAGGLVITVVVLLIILVFGPPVASEFTLPFYFLSRIVAFGRFFQRLESVFLLIWSMVGMIKAAVTLYAATVTLARVYRLADYRPLLWSVSLLCFALSILPPDLPTAFEWEGNYLRTWGILPTFFMPLTLLVISKLRKPEGQKNAVESRKN